MLPPRPGEGLSVALAAGGVTACSLNSRPVAGAAPLVVDPLVAAVAELPVEAGFPLPHNAYPPSSPTPMHVMTSRIIRNGDRGASGSSNVAKVAGAAAVTERWSFTIAARGRWIVSSSWGSR